MAAPIPPLLRPERVPRGPQVRYGYDGGAGPASPGRRPPVPRIIVREDERGREQLSLARPWRCDRCGATGTGCATDGFAHEEAEHCLTGCNGSLRASR